MAQHKYPISWHQEALKNFKASVDRKRQELERLQAEISKCESEIAYCEAQIARAIAEGKDSYNPENFKVKIHED